MVYIKNAIKMVAFFCIIEKCYALSYYTKTLRGIALRRKVEVAGATATGGEFRKRNSILSIDKCI